MTSAKTSFHWEKVLLEVKTVDVFSYRLPCSSRTFSASIVCFSVSLRLRIVKTKRKNSRKNFLLGIFGKSGGLAAEDARRRAQGSGPRGWGWKKLYGETDRQQDGAALRWQSRASCS